MQRSESSTAGLMLHREADSLSTWDFQTVTDTRDTTNSENCSTLINIWTNNCIIRKTTCKKTAKKSEPFLCCFCFCFWFLWCAKYFCILIFTEFWSNWSSTTNVHPRWQTEGMIQLHLPHCDTGSIISTVITHHGPSIVWTDVKRWSGHQPLHCLFGTWFCIDLTIYAAAAQS